MSYPGFERHVAANLGGYATAFQEETIEVRRLLLQEKQRTTLLEQALQKVLDMKRTHCCFCAKVLTPDDTVVWAESGLPVRFLCCKDHVSEAKMRLKDEMDARRKHDGR